MKNRPSHTEPKRRLNIAQLEQRLAVCRQTIWRWYKTGDFPQPHYLGQNRVWLESDVEAWEQRQMATRTTPPAVADRGAH